mmetsp:Transcript_29094/g.86130  ORF Transcript_29094/g.86130 Transcript_29094/m.86130 type:complete len:106 (+) Transcript_29094:694-1011(+)
MKPSALGVVSSGIVGFVVGSVNIGAVDICVGVLKKIGSVVVDGIGTKFGVVDIGDDALFGAVVVITGTVGCCVLEISLFLVVKCGVEACVWRNGALLLTEALKAL